MKRITFLPFALATLGLVVASGHRSLDSPVKCCRNNKGDAAGSMLTQARMEHWHSIA